MIISASKWTNRALSRLGLTVSQVLSRVTPLFPGTPVSPSSFYFTTSLITLIPIPSKFLGLSSSLTMNLVGLEEAELLSPHRALRFGPWHSPLQPVATQLPGCTHLAAKGLGLGPKSWPQSHLLATVMAVAGSLTQVSFVDDAGGLLLATLVIPEALVPGTHCNSFLDG